MDPRNLYISPLLTQLAVRWKNRAFIARQIFPEVPVSNDTFYYPVFDDAHVYRRTPTRYGHDASVNTLDFKVTKEVGKVEDRGLGANIDQKEVKQAGAIINAKTYKVEELLKAMALDLEIEIATMLRDTSVITQNETLVGAAQWTDSSSDPQKYVIEKAATLRLAPNVMVPSKTVHDKLCVHPKVREAVKFTDAAYDLDALSAKMARYFGVKRYLVGEAFYDTSKEGQSQSLSYIWGDDVLLAHVAENVTPMMNEPSLGYLPQMGSPPGPDGSVPAAEAMFRVYEGAPDPRRGTGAGSMFVKVDASYKALLTAAKLGFLIKDAV